MAPEVERRADRLFAPANVHLQTRPDGAVILSSPYALGKTARCVGDWLVRWASERPQDIFLRERTSSEPDAPWRSLSFGETLQHVTALGAGLLDLGLGAEQPLAILGDNSIDHALLSLAAQHVGVPIASISPAYSLASQDHEKLRAIIRVLTPGAIYVPQAQAFGAALAAISDCHNAAIIASEESDRALSLDSLAKMGSGSAVQSAFAALTADTVAKILFTSGSTGAPKGVINTQRMLTISQEAKAILWPFIEVSPPRILDWLPWSHTFGANHNFNLVLRNGGTLTIDNGKPAPGLFARTLANIREGAGTIYFNVPRGFDMLVAELKHDVALRKAFFSQLQVIFYAGAALPQNIWDELIRLAEDTLGEPVPMVCAWGSTETSPLATDCHFQAERSGVIGLPAPSVEIKLVPSGGKLEVRVRGPNVTPGYWRQPDLTRNAFDEESFYKIGDAVRLLDPKVPSKGLVFDGRVSEDFKLTTGTWVSVGDIRVKGIEFLAPLAQDIVVCGHDRDSIGFLVFTNMARAREIAGLPESAVPATVIAHPEVRARAEAGLRMMRERSPGSAGHARFAILMAEPASVDGGEITDKGYINQRAVLERRADFVERLFAADRSDPHVVAPFDRVAPIPS